MRRSRLWRLLGAARRRVFPPPTVAFVLRLPIAATPVPEGIVVRELSRTEVSSLLSESPEAVDAVAPLGWRCFVAMDGARVLHASFVQPTATGPLLFRASTVPARRGEGLFGVVARRIACEVAREGAPALRSSCARENRASVRAHRAAGFVG